MSTVKHVLGTKTSLTATGLSTLASATYLASDAYTCNTNQPSDVVIEFACTATSPVSNKQVILFIQESLDGTDFRGGPASGTTTTDEPSLKLLGVVPVLLSATTARGQFSLYAALGFIPYAFKIVAKNECGVALTSGTLHTAEVVTTVV